MLYNKFFVPAYMYLCVHVELTVVLCVQHTHMNSRLSSGAMQCEMHVFTTMGNNIKHKNGNKQRCAERAKDKI